MTKAQIPLLLKNTTTVFLEEVAPDYPVLLVKNEHGTAKVALHGAHLYEWVPTGHAPVLYTSSTALFKAGTAVRGGVPLCWPWFNAHPTDSTLPSHGLVRNRFWELTEISESPEETCLTFYIESDPETEKLWPHSFSTSVTITIGHELKIALYTENIDSKDFTVGGALHTYLSVGAVEEVTIKGLDGATYLDTVGLECERQQEGDLTIHSEVDRIYAPHDREIVLHDPILQRNITVTRTGSRSAVVWNPWEEKAAKLKDLPDAAYQDFVCIEAANARGDVQTLQPGQSHTLSTTLSVEST